MSKIVVLGANGQLGTCLKKEAPSYLASSLVFLSSSDLDITDKNAVTHFLAKDNYTFCVNCAAYTNVDGAEDEEDMAYKINAEAAGVLAKACEQNQIKLIHISTDFVFDGAKNSPYKETDDTNPLGVYGKTKLDGEKAIQEVTDKFFIIRTSWLYSEFGKNFMKTMINLSKTRDGLSVVSDQIGTPTYAVDLAKVIFKIIELDSDKYGIYHYSNKGVLSWFDFASKIFELKRIPIDLSPIATKDYPTKAQRPLYSVLDKTKIISNFDITIENWENRLEVALNEMND
jgi:dTDP-4-dehydrorhamnose reductase